MLKKHWGQDIWLTDDGMVSVCVCTHAPAKLGKECGLPGGNHLAKALKDKDTLVKKRRGTCTKVGAKVGKSETTW